MALLLFIISFIYCIAASICTDGQRIEQRYPPRTPWRRGHHYLGRQPRKGAARRRSAADMRASSMLHFFHRQKQTTCRHANQHGLSRWSFRPVCLMLFSVSLADADATIPRKIQCCFSLSSDARVRHAFRAAAAALCRTALVTQHVHLTRLYDKIQGMSAPFRRHEAAQRGARRTVKPGRLPALVW